MALGADWEDREEELFGPAETLHSTYRLLRDELLESTDACRRAARRAAVRHRSRRLPRGRPVPGAAEAGGADRAARGFRASPRRCGTSTRGSCKRSPPSSARSSGHRRSMTICWMPSATRAAERRRSPRATSRRWSRSCPRRGDGVVLSASDIDTYRTCPLKYKFARVFRIPQEPTVHQRFGILVHQVLERFHAREGAAGSLAELLGLLDAGWRRGGFGDSEEERQLRGQGRHRAEHAITSASSPRRREPMWFERQFTFKLGPHLLRGRVDRVDRLPGGEYELIDYKTGRPKSRGSARRRRPAVAVRGRRARGVEPRGLAAGLLLPARRREGRGRRRGRSRRSGSARSRTRSRRGSCRRGSSRRRRSRRARSATTGWCARRRSGSGAGSPGPSAMNTSKPRIYLGFDGFMAPGGY